jgi:hypothetical protein
MRNFKYFSYMTVKIPGLEMMHCFVITIQLFTSTEGYLQMKTEESQKNLDRNENMQSSVCNLNLNFYFNSLSDTNGRGGPWSCDDSMPHCSGMPRR